MAQIPYKIYLDESELPKAWYNLLSLIHISEPTRVALIAYAVFCV